MAGEIEDCISVQAEHLPTGSISFGRFELESLSWERRSSFSHNRYLEEVEKFSTPGSVTQKRAILEAHFKKKPPLSQVSQDDLNEGRSHTTENRTYGCASYDNECEDHDVYDEMPADSDEHEVMKCELEKNSLPKFPTEKTTPCTVEPTCELSDHEILQHQSEDDSVLPNKDDLCIVAEQEPHNKGVIIEELLEKKEVVIVEESVEKRDIPSMGPIIEKKSVPSLTKNTHKAPPEMKGAVQETSKTKPNSQFPVQQNPRKAPVERSYAPPGKMLSKSTGKLEREDASRTKSLKQLPPRTPRPNSSDSKNPNLEASVDMRAKRQGSRSEKDVRMKNAIIPHSVCGRSEMDFRRSVIRPRQVADSIKEETKQKGVGFNFRSDERAEKRKEYFMKLEEKLHAKEAEMSEIQVKTQEEREAALKQLRRSLNFKATPMPSFYHGVVPRVSEEKKIATPAKPKKLQSKSTSPGSRTSREKSPSISKASNREIPSNDELKQASGSTRSSGTIKKDERSKLNTGGSHSRRKGEFLNRVRRGGIVGGSVAVHVAS